MKMKKNKSQSLRKGEGKQNRRRMSEDGGWKLEVGSRKTEVGCWKLEVGCWMLDVGS